MGKSKTVNALVLSDVARVGELTATRDSGAHTTTFSRFYRLDKDTSIIDTPGFQSFGLFHLTEDQIGEAMREFQPYLGRLQVQRLLAPVGAGVRGHRGGGKRRDQRPAPVVLPGADRAAPRAARGTPGVEEIASAR